MCPAGAGSLREFARHRAVNRRSKPRHPLGLAANTSPVRSEAPQGVLQGKAWAAGLKTVGARLRVRGEALATEDRSVHPVFLTEGRGASGPVGPNRRPAKVLTPFPIDRLLRPFRLLLG